jgi:hypothetical protein
VAVARFLRGVRHARLFPVVFENGLHPSGRA